MFTKKKKYNTFNGLGHKQECLIVQKSRPLLKLWQARNLGLFELKILDMYLARINSHLSDKTAVVLSKNEIERTLGFKNLKLKDIRRRVNRLMSPIFIDGIDGEKGTNWTVLFERAEFEKDPISNQWEIRLNCTKKSKQLFFNIEKIGYLRYALQSIISFTSRQSYLMFLLIEQHKFRKDFVIKIEELKRVLGCQDSVLYQDYWRFNEKVLKKAYIDICEKTETRYRYVPIKNNRNRVVAVRFVFTEEDEQEQESVNMNTIRGEQTKVSQHLLGNRMIYKSRKLLGLSSLSLVEMKLIDLYISRIDNEDERTKCVGFSKAEVEKLLGMRITREALQRTLDQLTGDILLSHTENAQRIRLFKRTKLRKDDVSGLLGFSLECTNEAKSFFFDITKNGYIKYKLSEILSVNSKAVYVLLMLLKENQYKKTFVMDFDVLRNALGYSESFLYTSYMRFNDKILSHIQKELCNKIGLKFEYKPIRQSRTVVAVQFIVLVNEDMDVVGAEAIHVKEAERKQVEQSEAPEADKSLLTSSEDECEDVDIFEGVDLSWF